MRRRTLRFHDPRRMLKDDAMPVPARRLTGARVSYKTYPRFPARELDAAASGSIPADPSWDGPSLEASRPPATLSYRELCTVLYWSAGIRRGARDASSGATQARRMYASAGAIFPVEVYVFSNGVESLADGLHHFNVKHDLLEQLLAQDMRDEARAIAGGRAEAHWPAIVCLTGVLSRSQEVHGRDALRHALIEAGRIGQNIHLLARRLARHCSAVETFDDERLAGVLDLTGSEVPLCMIGLQ